MARGPVESNRSPLSTTPQSIRPQKNPPSRLGSIDCTLFCWRCVMTLLLFSNSLWIFVVSITWTLAARASRRGRGRATLSSTTCFRCLETIACG